ncbi:MAG: ATPase, T2SS/T4P/T4SS family [Gemmatales bacterium]|nr:ATPase, T2SS/T4P/T4SS family [Gemmatales bacterium]MDW8385769.1 ATPase, T2SS/T4P/T4SS family [Gemmatales bacterium]
MDGSAIVQFGSFPPGTLTGFAEVWAADFPRGPGLYLNLYSVAAVLAVYLAWIRIFGWMDRDARAHRLNRYVWNQLGLLGCILGFLAFWVVPWFAFAFAALLLLTGTPLVAYLIRRNSVVPDADRLFTERHLRGLLNRYFRTRLRVPKPALTHEVALLLKPGEERKDSGPPRIQDVEKSAGYDLALRILCEAYDRAAPIFQIEPLRDQARIRLRIDGVFQEHERLPRLQAESALRVFKRLADLNLDEHRKPQHGNFAVELDGRRIDLDVQSSGNLAGERLTVRIRDRRRKLPSLDDLDLRESLGRLLRFPNGLLVIAGPPDSGKTTLGYACLHDVLRQQRRAATVERDIEYHLDHAQQFALGNDPLQGIGGIRQRLFGSEPPEVILLDVPLDEALTEQVYEAASHSLILLIVEAEDLVSGLDELRRVGLSSARLAKKLVGGVGTRLIRLLCAECKVYYKPNPEVLQRLNLSADRVERLARPPEGAELIHEEDGSVKRCPSCRGIGFRGRRGLYEVLAMTERLREGLRDDPDAESLRQLAILSGMKPVETAALDLVTAGLTSVAEMLSLFHHDAKPMPLALPADSTRIPQPQPA